MQCRGHYIDVVEMGFFAHPVYTRLKRRVQF